MKGEKAIQSFEDREAKAVRKFCGECGTPIAYERASSPQMVNTPRALFETRTGREPRYHANIDELQEWTYLGERLSPLKGFPGIVWDRSRKKKALETL